MMNLIPVRLHPGDDLRAALVDRVAQGGAGSAFVMSAIGSLHEARLRFAGAARESVIDGPLEIVSMSGSVTPAGAHLHMVVSDSEGRVIGGHVCPGNLVRTTAEALLVLLLEWTLTREPDPATGYDELVIRTRAHGE